MDENLLDSWIADCERAKFIQADNSVEIMTEKMSTLRYLIDRIISQKEQLLDEGFGISDFLAFNQKFTSDIKKFVDSNGKSENASTLLVRGQTKLLSILKAWHDQLYVKDIVNFSRVETKKPLSWSLYCTWT